MPIFCACTLNDGRLIGNLIVCALRGLVITIYGEGLQTRSFYYIDSLVEGFF
jgi:UDP-glucuronate decarboxylase